MFAFILEVLGNPIVSGIFGVLIGALLGNHFAIGQAKRNEFNVATEQIRLDAISQFDAMKADEPGCHISRKSILDLRAAIGDKRSAKIVSAFNAYDQAYKTVRVDVPGTADEPFHKQEIISEEIPKYKSKLKNLISTLETK